MRRQPDPVTCCTADFVGLDNLTFAVRDQGPLGAVGLGDEHLPAPVVTVRQPMRSRIGSSIPALQQKFLPWSGTPGKALTRSSVSSLA